MSAPTSVVIDGITFLPQSPPSGRAVVVVDRGWIFAGDIRRSDGRIHLTNAVWVFKEQAQTAFWWDSCGFAEVIENPSKAYIRSVADVDIPSGAEIFCIAVPAGWGQ